MPTSEAPSSPIFCSWAVRGLKPSLLTVHGGEGEGVHGEWVVFWVRWGGGGLKENVFRSYAVIFKRIFQFIGVIKTFW